MASTSSPRRKNRKIEIAVCLIAGLLAIVILLGVIFSCNSSRNASSGSDESVSFAGSTETVSVADDSESTAGSSSAASSVSSSQTASAVTEPSSVSSQTTVSSGKTDGDYITYTKSGADELSEWYLKLVNYENTLSQDWSPDSLSVIYESSYTYKLDSRAVTAYRDMVAAAKADGVSIYPISAFRTWEMQASNFARRVERAKSDNPTFTQAEAEAEAARNVARPGTSEHEVGLAIDFNSVEESFANTAAGQWLYAHSTEYGFILRYARDKQDITKVTWEPWHFRFVGVKHAQRMKELGMCLEEYTSYLENGGR